MSYSKLTVILKRNKVKDDLENNEKKLIKVLDDKLKEYYYDTKVDPYIAKDFNEVVIDLFSYSLLIKGDASLRTRNYEDAMFVAQDGEELDLPPEIEREVEIKQKNENKEKTRRRIERLKLINKNPFLKNMYIKKQKYVENFEGEVNPKLKFTIDNKYKIIKWANNNKDVIKKWGNQIDYNLFRGKITDNGELTTINPKGRIDTWGFVEKENNDIHLKTKTGELVPYARVKNIDWTKTKELEHDEEEYQKKKYKPITRKEPVGFDFAYEILLKNNKWKEQLSDKILSTEEISKLTIDDYYKIEDNPFIQKNMPLKKWKENFYDMFIKDLNPNDIVVMIKYYH